MNKKWWKHKAARKKPVRTDHRRKKGDGGKEKKTPNLGRKPRLFCRRIIPLKMPLDADGKANKIRSFHAQLGSRERDL